MARRVHVRDFGYVGTATYEYVGRPSRLGNPFVISREMSRDKVVDAFEEWLPTQPALMAYVATLRGKDLGCHCGPRQRCHGDVILRLANPPRPW